jgi:hypothetical protein
MPHKIALKTWAPDLQRTVKETLRCVRCTRVARVLSPSRMRIGKAVAFGDGGEDGVLVAW